MRNLRCVLLIHDDTDAFRGLEEGLRELQIRTRRAHRCSEAVSLLEDLDRPELVLTDVRLADGTWKDVIELAHKAAKDTPVIVISRVVSMNLYLDTQDGGAADFIVPPIAPRDLDHVLASAVQRNRAAAPIRRPRVQPSRDQSSTR